MSSSVDEMTAPARTATPESLEQRFGISSATWRRWVSQGRLAGYRLSARRMVIDLDEAEQLVLQGKVKPAVEAGAAG